MDRAYRALSPDYPPSLRELKAPPDPLWVRGDLPRGRGIAVVGTRTCSTDAARYTRGLARRLAEHGLVVWSGGAKGIDAAAHEGVLEAGGITVAVVATGLDECYPPEHADLYERIVRGGGAIVSAFDPAEKATYATFHYRNGVLAALTEATVLVQTRIRGGARSTVARARRLKRPLFVAPAAPWDDKGRGNLIEIERGARMLTTDAPLLSLFGIIEQRGAKPVSSGAPEKKISPACEKISPACEKISPACEKVLAAAEIGPGHLDDLCARSGLPAPLVQEALLTLTLQAVLVEGPSGWYRRISC
jgi:DNA processing protein